MTAPTLVERLADHVVGLRFDDLSPAAIEAVKQRLVHHLGLAFQARLSEDREPAARLARDLSRAGGDVTVIGQREKAGVADAVFANAVFMGHGGMDDGLMPGGVHPGTVTLPVALAVGEQERANGREFIAAVVVGYDLMGKLARPSFSWTAESPRRPNMVFAPTGAAATATRLLKLSRDQAAHALAHGANASTGLLESSAFPWAMHPTLARNGHFAATLAKAGFAMTPTMIDGRHGLFRSFYGEVPDGVEAEIAQLGSDFEVCKTIIKRWRSSGFNIIPMQFALDLVAEHRFGAADIAAVTLVLPAERRERELVWDEAYARQPSETLRTAVARFQMAVCLTDGRIDERRYVEEPAPDVASVFDKVALAFEEHRPILYARLEVELRDGRRFVKEGDTWDARQYELPRTEWSEWLARSGRGVLPSQRIERLESLIANLERVDDVAEVAACLVP